MRIACPKGKGFLYLCSRTEKKINMKNTRRLLSRAFALLLSAWCTTPFASLQAQPKYAMEKLQMEHLNRGVVAVRASADTVAVSWRYLQTDASDVAFHVYRNGVQITQTPVSVGTIYYDYNPSKEAAVYEVKPADVSRKQAKKEGGRWLLPAEAPTGYLSIPLEKPEIVPMPDNEKYTYLPNDASAADLDGDGEMEIVLKWDPTNSHDNAHSGFTGPTYIDAYKFNGKRLWRINLGRNIRSGAHYTQFMVYDLDGDGCAEVVMKTSDGTVDGKGKVIGNPDADHRMQHGHVAGDLPEGSEMPRGRVGYIAYGPEYLTVFNGKTGAAMQTIDYIPERGDLRAWGDNYANRSERYLACVAYLDGMKPSVVMCRGYYTRAVLAAFDWDGKELKPRWVFDSNEERHRTYAGQGNHNLRVGDVDGDGCDEIVYGSCCIDHNGEGLYNTRMGHGDAMHLTRFLPEAEGLQVWDCHENRRDGSTLRDAATGKVLFQIPHNTDVGRCMATDIDPTSYGLEMWSSASDGIRNSKGEVVYPSPKGLSINMAVWWDGDLLRELLDREKVSKYDWNTGECRTIAHFEGCRFNNGTKSNPCLQGDLLGDWREEVLTRTEAGDELRLYVSTLPTEYRFHTFLHDPVYRHGITTQNVAYNQPTQPGFYFGAELEYSGKEFRGYMFPAK